MKPYLKGESQPRTASVKGDVVTIHHVTKFDNGQEMYMKTLVDLSRETSDDIKKNAAANYLIQVLRTRALKPNKPEAIDEDKAMRPCDYPATRATADPNVAARRAAKKLSPEERAELIIELNEMD